MKRLLVIPLLVIVLTATSVVSSRQPGSPPCPAVDPQWNMPSGIRNIVSGSCTDCHSSNTRWPWYAKIPPASWAVRHDVERARHAFNLSQPPPQGTNSAARSIATVAAACNDIQSGRMPLPRYLWLHPGAKPTTAQIVAFCDWTRTETTDLLEKKKLAAKH
jgi:hypothetical protein